MRKLKFLESVGGLGDDRPDQGRRDGLPGNCAVQEAEEDGEGERALQEEAEETEERVHTGSTRTGTASTVTLILLLRISLYIFHSFFGS